MLETSVGSKTAANSFIDDAAEDQSKDNNSDIEDLDSEHSSDKAFINDASDLSVYSKDDNPMDIDGHDESDLSPLSEGEDLRPTADPGTLSEDEVVIVDTSPTVKRRRKARGKRVVSDINSEDDASAIQPGDSMFTKRGAVKASTLPPPMKTRSTKPVSSPSTPSTKTRSGKSAAAPPAAPNRMVDSEIGESVQKNKKTEVNSQATQSKSEGHLDDTHSLDAVETDATLPSPTNMKAEMESILAEMLDSRLDGIAQSLMMQLTPMLRLATAASNTVPTDSKTQPLPAPYPEDMEDDVHVESDVLRSPVQTKDSIVGHSQTNHPASRVLDSQRSAMGVATRGPDQSADITGHVPSVSNAPGFGTSNVQYWTDPVTPPRKLTAEFSTEPRSLRPNFEFSSNQNASSAGMSTAAQDSPGVSTAAQDSRAVEVAQLSVPKAEPLQSSFVMSSQSSNATPPPTPSAKGKGSTVASPASTVASPARDNLARMFASNRIESSKRSANESQGDNNSPKRTKYHDDLVTYSILFTPPEECGVSDSRLQDEAIKDVYVGLCNLPAGRKLLPSYVRSESGEDWHPGGRLAFSYWFRSLTEVSAISLYNAMSFKRCGRYFAPQRESPDCLSLVQEPGGSPHTFRLYLGSEYAVGVTPGLCFESYVVEPFRSNANPPRYRKFVSVLFHNQDWERFVAFMCCCFDRKSLHVQMTGKAVHFSTKMNSIEAAKQTSVADRLQKYTDDPKQTGSSAKRPPPRNKFSLDFTDDVPVYDARGHDFDFATDLPNLATALPPWPQKEIPEGSFVNVGYTVSTYKGTASGYTDRVLHLGCNLQWVVVCGTPAPKDTDD